MRQKQEEKEKKNSLLKENRLFEAKIVSQKSSLVGDKKRRPRLRDKQKSNINKGRVGNLKGHIGSFSNGVLKLKKHDLKKLNI
jgi:hypothetical protein